MNEWKIRQHTYQIADTGDYDGSVEITNGKISLFCDCDVENEELNPIIDALNNSEIEFEIDDSPSMELHYENERLREELKRFEDAVEVNWVAGNLMSNGGLQIREKPYPFIDVSKYTLYAIPKEIKE